MFVFCNSIVPLGTKSVVRSSSLFIIDAWPCKWNEVENNVLGHAIIGTATEENVNRNESLIFFFKKALISVSHSL